MQQQITHSEHFIIIDIRSEVASVSGDCAWCNQEAGIPQGEGSHGICVRHAEQQYNMLRARTHKAASPDTRH